MESVKFDSSEKTVQVDSTVTLSVTINPSDAEYKNITVISSNKSVATADLSEKEKVVTVKGVKAGETIVTVTVDTATATCKITVPTPGPEPEPEPTVYTVTLDQKTAEMEVGDTIALLAKVVPSRGATLKWGSRSGEVTVTGNGTKVIVKAIAAGETVVYCIVNDNEEFKDSCQVKVNYSGPVYPEASDLYCVKIDSLWWAPVNCGYDTTSADLKYGRLYQWGRKYGQLYDTKPTIIGEGITTEEGNDEKNKDKFYTAWSPTDVERWPSEYDPCPKNWHVPTKDEMGGLCYTDYDPSTGSGDISRGSWDDVKKGWDFDGLFFPTAGDREGNGDVRSRGTCGFYWTSDTTQYACAYELYFDVGVSIGSFYMTHGRPVRCVWNTEK